MLTPEQIKSIGEKFEHEKTELQKQIEEHSKLVSFGEEGRVEDTGSEKADEAEEFSNNLAIARAYRERLEEVENALNKIKEGKFGTCEKCGREIPAEALLKNPTTRACPSCSR